MKINIPKNQGSLIIRAYCHTCGKLLQESTMMSKKQLRVNWDRAVLGAVGIKCEDCKHKFPNFDIDLKIYNARLDREYDPSAYINVKGKDTPDDLFRAVSKRWLAEHPDVVEPTQEDVVSSLAQVQQDISPVTQEERLKHALELRSKVYGNER